MFQTTNPSCASLKSPILPSLCLLNQESAHVTDPNLINDFDSIPAEIISKCLSDYSDWGDLAKLSCVQKSWSTLLHTASQSQGQFSQWELAQALMSGSNGLEPNPSQAFKYLVELSEAEKSVNDCNNTVGEDASNKYEIQILAMKKLAMCYFVGDGTEEDKNSGLMWLKKAAQECNDIDAAHELALIYEYGEHNVDCDVVAACEWFLIAAVNGHTGAMAEYAMCCELGCGREQSDEEALEWYVKAANSGHIEANFSVGEAFEEAKGVPQSDGEACMWYYKAAVMGDEDSKKALLRLSDIASIVVPGWSNQLGSILNA
mmetsp:Transcript_57309/g.66937  ORF Transcript_57309/g.66937 Transcript_57309/m.66937 type:complete len:317 (-) Transcript_57309:123-1073(-)